MTKKVGNEKPNPGVEGVMKRLKIAVESGKITEEEAKKRMVEYKKRLSNEGAKKGKSNNAELAKKIRAAVKEGKLTKEEAREKMQSLRKRTK